MQHCEQKYRLLFYTFTVLALNIIPSFNYTTTLCFITLPPLESAAQQLLALATTPSGSNDNNMTAATAHTVCRFTSYIEGRAQHAIVALP